jgi:glycosyltransferase involved in cell wall biosynthesis
MNRRVAVIIPAYNEEDSIADVVNRVKGLGEGYDVVVVNDDSRDKTSEKAREAGAIVVDLPYNLGIGGAVQTGFKFAWAEGYDACVQVDGDGQHPARDISKLLVPLFDDDYDLVIGSRFVTETNYKISAMRAVGIKILSIFLRVATGLIVKDTTSGFRAVNRKAMELFSREYPQDYPEPESLVFAHQHQFKVLEIPVQMTNRMYGVSSITPVMAAYYMAKVLLAMFIDLFKRP